MKHTDRERYIDLISLVFQLRKSSKSGHNISTKWQHSHIHQVRAEFFADLMTWTFWTENWTTS